MQIRRNGSQGASKGPAEYFTGAVRIEPLFQSPGPAPLRWWPPVAAATAIAGHFTTPAEL